MTAHFDIRLEDMNDSGSFASSIGVNQINFTPDGGTAPLRTSGAVDPDPQRSLTTWSYSDIMQGAAANRPIGASYDVFNQSLSNDLVGILNSEGNIRDLLGSSQAYAPYDIVSRGQFGPVGGPNAATAAPSATSGSGVGAVAGDIQYSAQAPPSGEYRGTTEMRQIWGNRCAAGGELVPYTFRAGDQTYQVRDATVPVWEMIDGIFQRHNYSIYQNSGGFNCRQITGGSGLSLHSFGIACDFNAGDNPYTGSTLITNMPEAMVLEIEAIRTRNSGIRVVKWGGRYTNHKDAMHYEVMCTPGELAEGFATY